MAVVGLGYLVVEVGTYLCNLFLSAHLLVSHHVGLSAALMVGIHGLRFAAIHIPSVEVAPVINVLHVSLLRVYAVEREESFVIHGTRPEV